MDRGQELKSSERLKIKIIRTRELAILQPINYTIVTNIVLSLDYTIVKTIVQSLDYTIVKIIV